MAKDKDKDKVKAEESVKDQPKTEKKPAFYICDGKSLLCTGRGSLNEGDEIRPEWLAGGSERIAELVKQGVIAKGA